MIRKDFIKLVAPLNSNINTCGRNLLQTRAFLVPSGAPDVIDVAEGWVSDSTPSSDSRSWNYANSSWKIDNLPAGTYTLSWDVKTTISSNGAHIYVYASDGTMLRFVSDQFKVAGQYGASFTLAATTSIGIMFKIMAGVARFKLEKGTTFTSWSLAPEDIQTQIDALNSKTIQRNIVATEDLNGIKNTGNYSIDNSSTANWPFTTYGVLFVRNCLAYVEQYAVSAISQETMARISLDGGTSWRSWKTIVSPS